MNTPTDFDYYYFDDPNAFGYQGYECPNALSPVMSLWNSIASICNREHVHTALDIGCAKGFLVEFLISRGIDAVGYDISNYALSFARLLPCFQHDIRNGVPRRGDAIIALGVLIYLRPDELPNVLAKIRSATDKVFFLCSLP